MLKHRLVCIGDSLTQGFKSGAIFEPNLSFPSTIAWELGLADEEFRYPSFAGQGGLPTNIEFLLRRLDHQFGADIDWWEWPLAPIFLRQWMDEIEDYWERGPGTAPVRYGGPYHNLGVFGFQVQDAYLLKAGFCQQIASEVSDDWVSQVVGNGMYRAALRVLNPSQVPANDEATQISRAQELADAEGIENLLVFLGANNALGAVTALTVTPSTAAELLNPDPRQRPANLYSPEHFQTVFSELVKHVEQIGAERVFWGTVPPVTIPPVTNGVGGRMDTDLGLASPYGSEDHPQWYRRYFRYYTRPWVSDATFRSIEDPYLTGQQAMEIDWTIAQYKRILLEAVAHHNASRRRAHKPQDWFVVDIHWALERIAYRRYSEDPSVPPPPGWSPYEMPECLNRLQLDTRFLRAKQGQRVAGGIFSLDGVHATTVAYGLIAQEFINVMQQAGVAFYWGDRSTPRVGPVIVDCERLLRLDTLLQSLPRTLDDVWDTLVDGDQILDIFKRALRVFG
jgi:hypothetical protein